MEFEHEATPKFSKAEKFKILNSLTCLVHGLKDRATQIDLRDERSVYGIVLDVDGEMNVTLTDCHLLCGGLIYSFQELFIRSRLIRYVHVPEEMDIVKTMWNAIGNITKPGRKGIDRSRTRKTLLAKKRDRETMRLNANQVSESATQSAEA